MSDPLPHRYSRSSGARLRSQSSRHSLNQPRESEMGYKRPHVGIPKYSEKDYWDDHHAARASAAYGEHHQQPGGRQGARTPHSGSTSKLYQHDTRYDTRHTGTSGQSASHRYQPDYLPKREAHLREDDFPSRPKTPRAYSRPTSSHWDPNRRVRTDVYRSTLENELPRYEGPRVDSGNLPPQSDFHFSHVVPPKGVASPYPRASETRQNKDPSIIGRRAGASRSTTPLRESVVRPEESISRVGSRPSFARPEDRGSKLDIARLSQNYMDLAYGNDASKENALRHLDARFARLGARVLSSQQYEDDAATRDATLCYRDQASETEALLQKSLHRQKTLEDALYASYVSQIETERCLQAMNVALTRTETDFRRYFTLGGAPPTIDPSLSSTLDELQNRSRFERARFEEESPINPYLKAESASRRGRSSH